MLQLSLTGLCEITNNRCLLLLWGFTLHAVSVLETIVVTPRIRAIETLEQALRIPRNIPYILKPQILKTTNFLSWKV